MYNCNQACTLRASSVHMHRPSAQVLHVTRDTAHMQLRPPQQPYQEFDRARNLNTIVHSQPRLTLLWACPFKRCMSAACQHTSLNYNKEEGLLAFQASSCHV